MSENYGMQAGTHKPRPSLNTLAHLLGGSTPAFPASAVIQTAIKFNDISFYQLAANFETMRLAGSSGVILRAGQRNYVDSCYRKFHAAARIERFPVGSYWLYDSRAKPRDQARLWHDTIGNDTHVLLDWMDYEENYRGPYRGWRHLYDFAEYCKEEMPDRKFGIYTGYYYWLANSPSPLSQKLQLLYFKKYPLWLAWYTKDPTRVRIPRPWANLWGWQYGFENGIQFGVGSKEIDGDYFNGSRAEWDTLIGRHYTEA